MTSATMNASTPEQASAAASPAAELSPLESAVLELEHRHFARPGDKERAIQDSFQLSPTRYFQIVNAMIDDPRVVCRDPVLVNRLRRLRSARRATR